MLATGSSVMLTYARADVTFVEGEGCRLTDSSAARTAVDPMSSPMRPFAIYRSSTWTERSSRKRWRSASRSR